jgi:hypothetical protein
MTLIEKYDEMMTITILIQTSMDYKPCHMAVEFNIFRFLMLLTGKKEKRKKKGKKKEKKRKKKGK